MLLSRLVPLLLAAAAAAAATAENSIGGAVVAEAAGVVKLPDHHPQLVEFGGYFRCPYAQQWLTKGPKQAAIDLGIIPYHPHHGGSRRHLQSSGGGESATVAGSCVYENPFAGSSVCVDFRDGSSASWTVDSMTDRCSAVRGTVTEGAACSVAGNIAGYCVVESQAGMMEATPMLLGDASCNSVQNTCETMIEGTFEVTLLCSGKTTTAGDSSSGNNNSGSLLGSTFSNVPRTTCEIAPGAIGGAHQAGFSSGYQERCEGTPGEGSPYLWPLRWSADTNSQSMAFGSDEVVYESRGKVYYRLDNNWKRNDWLYQQGVQRAIGQSFCAPENIVGDADGPTLACRRDSDKRSTMIHRGAKMFFLSWTNGTLGDDVSDISNCTWLDLQVVGNVRPDWFMDKRGDTTDTQYLGDQHVYYNGQPKLVKQWRKKDFASQYFTMSMLANPGNDTIHWPLMLNVPGEGFGDDFLQIYTNHQLLTDDDNALFLLPEAYEAAGGTCIDMSSRDSSVGPPTSEVEPIPSNLELDPNSWFTNEYTYSDVWEPPKELVDTVNNPALGDMAMTEAGTATIGSCFDSATSTVQLSITFNDVVASSDADLPWVAIGYRQDEECLMLPRDGSDTNIVLVSNDPASGDLSAFFGTMTEATKSMSGDDVFEVYRTLKALDTVDGYSDVFVLGPSSGDVVTVASTDAAPAVNANSVVLSFKQQMEAVPDAMHLMYAIGSGPMLGYHANRLCFEVTEFPDCTTGGGGGGASQGDVGGASQGVVGASQGVVPDGVPTAEDFGDQSTTTTTTTAANEASSSVGFFSSERTASVLGVSMLTLLLSFV